MNNLPLSVALSGASGLVGSALVNALEERGSTIRPLVRREPSSPKEIPWTPGQPIGEPHWQGVDALVHLAGENIAGGRWNPARKERLWKSRVESTRALCEGLAASPEGPRVLICASAIGFYGDRGDEELLENSAPGKGFLAELTQAWEAACQPAKAAGIRVVHLRFGIILSKDGGALAKMLTPFRMGAGGRVGSGKQFWSWVSLADAVGAIEHALTHSAVQGPVNVVAPNTVRNSEFTKELGRALGRPTFFPLPAFAAKLALGGEMASGLLLASARVKPGALLETGYAFQHATLSDALAHSLA